MVIAFYKDIFNFLERKKVTVLKTHVPDPLEDDGNSGIDLFLRVCDFVKSVRNLP